MTPPRSGNRARAAGRSGRLASREQAAVFLWTAADEAVARRRGRGGFRGGFGWFGGGLPGSVPRRQLAVGDHHVLNLIKVSVGVFVKSFHFVEMEWTGAAAAKDHGLIAGFVHHPVAIP